MQPGSGGQGLGAVLASMEDEQGALGLSGQGGRGFLCQWWQLNEDEVEAAFEAAEKRGEMRGAEQVGGVVAGEMAGRNLVESCICCGQGEEFEGTQFGIDLAAKIVAQAEGFGEG